MLHSASSIRKPLHIESGKVVALYHHKSAEKHHGYLAGKKPFVLFVAFYTLFILALALLML